MARDEDKAVAQLNRKLDELDNLYKQFESIQTMVSKMEDNHIELRPSASAGSLKNAGASMLNMKRSASMTNASFHSAGSTKTTLAATSPTFPAFLTDVPLSPAAKPRGKKFPYQFGSLMKEEQIVEMKFQGESGLDMDNALIHRSFLQGWRKGIRPGWRINKLAGFVVTQDNEDEVPGLLKKCEASRAKYTIIFQRARAQFGTGAVTLSKHEQEREDNLERLRKWFKYHGSIARPEQRAISFTQLEKVVQYAEQNCAAWRDEADPAVSPHSGKPLAMDFFNFHHIKSWIITPTTDRKQSAFVEHLTSRRQVPEWCVSHVWGEPIVDFIKCIKAHAAIRSLKTETMYWISAFALEHKALQDEIALDKHQTSFYKALNQCHFHVLMVIDREAQLFQRTWCIYETSMCIGRSATPIDMVFLESWRQGFLKKEKVQSLTYGLTADEEEMEKKAKGEGIQAKFEREDTFPVNILAMTLDIQIEKTQAMKATDSAKILNCMLGQNLDSTPLLDSDFYEDTNKKIHSHFASLFLLRAAVKTTPDFAALAEIKVLWSKIVDAFQNDVWRNKLEFFLEGMTEEGMYLLVQCFPPNIQDMTMRFRGSPFTDPRLLEMIDAIGKLNKFHKSPDDEDDVTGRVSFDFTNCENVDETDLESFDLLRDLGVTVDLAISESEFSKAAGNPLTKAITFALHSNLVPGGVSLKTLNYRVLPAVPELVKSLTTDPEWRKRKAAAVALGCLGQSAYDALPELNTARNEDYEARVCAAAEIAYARISGGGDE